jgi:hypothetical protein
MSYVRTEEHRTLQREKHPATPAHIRVLRRSLLGDDCWEFQGAIDTYGYGVVQLRQKKTGKAHRAVYEAMVGPIPEGLTIDHLCRTTSCVNPDLMEPVTAEENSRRDSRARYG